jgi:hypothetical protein
MSSAPIARASMSNSRTGEDMEAGTPGQTPKKPGMSRTQKLLFFVTAWLICLMPFLFWWNTWFGRKLSDQQLTEYLHDTKKPRHIQQALVQVGERITRQDAAAKQWYPDLIRVAADPVEEVRNTDAWVMGQDTSVAGFHDALLKMLSDPSPMVRGNAALSLVRFGDAAGRPQILALLQPAHITSPESGRIIDSDRPGTAVHQAGLIAKLEFVNKQVAEIRSPIPGRIRTVAGTGASISKGAEIAVVDPANDQVWEALRALYLIGQSEDLPAIRPYERDLPDISNDVRQQASETDRAIHERTSK